MAASQKPIKLYNLNPVFPDPDSVGTTEYGAVYDMVSGGGHLEGALLADSALHVADMLSSIIEIAHEKRREIHTMLRRSPP
jgi:hypothetical protein